MLTGEDSTVGIFLFLSVSQRVLGWLSACLVFFLDNLLLLEVGLGRVSVSLPSSAEPDNVSL